MSEQTTNRSGAPPASLGTGPGGPAPVMGSAYFFVGGQSSYFGVQESEARQQMILGPKDTYLGLRASERTILALKSRVLAANYGPGAAIRNLACMIGSLKVQSISGDKEWSAIAEEYFNQRTSVGLKFDARGRHAIDAYQVLCSFRRLLDGDCFTAYAQSDSGHVRVRGYEGLLVEQGAKQANDPSWRDGVQCDLTTGFPLAFNFIERDAKGQRAETVIDARVVFHHLCDDTFSATRGVPVLAHALNNLQDIIEATAFQKRAIKLAAMIGLTPKVADPNSGPLPNQGVSAPLQRESVWFPPTQSAPSTPPVNVIFEQAMAAGLVGTRPFDVVHDDRPHPNSEEFKKTLLREAAIGLRMPPQLLFFMDDPGGAYARIILELAARTIAEQHRDHQAPFLRRTWASIVGRGMKMGHIPTPSKGDWLKIKLTPPRMPTADLGKMGRLYIELRRIGLQSHRTIYEELGYEFEEEIDQIGAEFRLFLDTEKKYNLPPGSLTNALLPQGSTLQSLEAANADEAA